MYNPHNPLKQVLLNLKHENEEQLKDLSNLPQVLELEWQGYDFYRSSQPLDFKTSPSGM